MNKKKIFDQKVKTQIVTADMHMHSSFSFDCYAEPENMIQAAIEKKMRTIYFTDHFDKDVIESGEECIFNLEKYFSILSSLKEKYYDRIDIRIGVELGLQSYLGEYYKKITEAWPFDFIIGSVHIIESSDPVSGKLFENRTDEEAYRIAFLETLEDIRTCQEFDVLGHLDYVIRYGKFKEKEYSYKNFSQEIDEILRFLIEKGKGLEVNTGGVKYGLPFIHPHPEVLKRYRELGGEIVTVGADGHRPEQIANVFDRVPDLLKECGFRYYTEFKNRKPVFVPIL